MINAIPLPWKIAGALGALLLIGAMFAYHRSVVRDRDDLKALAEEQAERIARLELSLVLHDVAGVEREEDHAEIHEMEEELIDAIREVPDENPDAVRVALGCQRLRRQGRAEDSLPAVCRPSGRAEAGSD